MLKVRVTIDMFSGRENPVVELKGKAAKEALERLQPDRRLAKDDPGAPQIPTLGYRGMVVSQEGGTAKRLPPSFRVMHGDLFGRNLNHKASDATFEDFILSRVGPASKLGLHDKFPNIVRREMRSFAKLRAGLVVNPAVIGPSVLLPVLNPCQCAPLYEPAWWNVPARQPYNNCYNYATNYRTNTFAQPGRAAGAMYGMN